MSYLGLTSPVIAPGNGTVTPATMSQGGPSWDSSGNVTVSGNLTATGNVVLGDASTDTLNVGNGGLVKDASGNVGVGVTPSGTWKLDVAGYVKSAAAAGGLYDAVYTGTTAGSTLGQLRFNGSGTGVTAESKILGGLSSGSITSSYLAFYTTNAGSQSQAMTLDASGNLLVGTTSGSGYRMEVTTSGVTTMKVSRTGLSGANSIVDWFYNTTNVGSVAVSSTATSYNTSSDYRLKNSVAPMTGALAKVAALKPCTYKWNADDSDGEGFIAHELAEVMPHAVTGEKDAVETYTDEEGNEQTRPKYQGIDTSFLVATLTAAIQEQQAIITQLTARIEALENK